MHFFLDVSIAGEQTSREIIHDYCVWFKKRDPVTLTVFFSKSLSPLLELQESAKNLSLPFPNEQPPKIRWVHKKVPFSSLHRYYSRKVLVNEINPYRMGDLFRIFRLTHPFLDSEPYESQATAIQFDLRYVKQFGAKNNPYKPAIVHDFVQYLSCNPTHSAIEFGCGAGSVFSLIKDQIQHPLKQYVGMDRSRSLIIKAKDTYQENREVSFQLGDISQIPYPNQAFDVGFSESVLPYISDPLKALREMKRVSRYGFFCRLYSIPKAPHNLPTGKDRQTILLNTGAVWKFDSQPRDHTFVIPKTSAVQSLVENWETVVVIQNQEDQFFKPLGIRTINFFIYPRSWYHTHKSIVNRSNHVLMQ